MQGFYLLAVQRQRRHRWILLAVCIIALLSLFFAIRQSKMIQPTAPATSPAAPYLVSSDNGTVIVTKAGETVWRTEIDVRSLPKADQEELARGIELPDEQALAHLLEDYDA